MASLNKVMLIGNLGKDPDVKFTQAGTAVCNFSLAVSEKYKDKGGEWVEKTEWVNVVLWGKLAEIAGEYLGKGKQIYLEGRLQTRKWQDSNGADKYTTEVVGDKMLMLGGKGERKDTGGSGAGDKPVNNEPAFDPDSDIPF